MVVVLSNDVTLRELEPQVPGEAFVPVKAVKVVPLVLKEYAVVPPVVLEDDAPSVTVVVCVWPEIVCRRITFGFELVQLHVLVAPLPKVTEFELFLQRWSSV